MTDTNKLKSYEKFSKTIIPKLEARGFAGYYCNTKEEAAALAQSLIPAGSSIAWGGSESIKECGLMDLLKSGDYQLLDRATAVTDEEKDAMYLKHMTSDYFLMSANAITEDGQLVNIDGNGNRVACLIKGPKNVIVIAGMNKLASSVDQGIHRTFNLAAPPNAERLGLTTPCGRFGKCTECLGDNCMCSQIVITRMSRIKDRIKIILVGEELGY